MHIATLYDMHGNLSALEAVLAEIPDDATAAPRNDVDIFTERDEAVELFSERGL
jgi:hypothetical protein